MALHDGGPARDCLAPHPSSIFSRPLSVPQIQPGHQAFINDILFLFNVYLFLRERKTQSVNRGGAERERETQSPKQAPDSELSAHSSDVGLEPTD